MFDPLSTTASTIAIVGFAGESCQFLFEFFRTVSGAPREVEHHVSSLRALRATFTGIESLSNDISLDGALPQEFHIRLKECMADIKAIELRVRKANEDLERSKLRRTWTRLKWSSSADHWLSKFLARVHSYHTTFCLDLLTLQIRLNVSHSALSPPADGALLSSKRESQISTLEQIPLPGCYGQVCHGSVDGSPKEVSETERSCLTKSSKRLETATTRCMCPDLDNSSFDGVEAKNCTSRAIPTSLKQFLESYMGPISIRASTLRQFKTLFADINLWLGPIMIQRWTATQSPIYEISAPNRGYGLAIVAQPSFCYLHRVSFTLLFMRGHNQNLGNLSVRWNLSFSRVVPNDANIMRFARTNNLHAIQDLIQSGHAAASDITPTGTTLLHIAAARNSANMIRFFLQEGASVNAINDDGETPLHVAVAKASDYDVSRLLIESGADLGSCSIDGKTPLHTFFNEVVKRIILCHREAVEEEIPDSQGMTLLHFLAWSSKSRPEHFEPYIGKGRSSFLARDNQGRSMLHFAAQRGNTLILEYLFQLPIEMDSRRKDDLGRTLLHYAVESRRVETIDMMVSRKADIRAVDNLGRTVLHRAAMCNNLAAVKRVIELGSEEDLWSTDGDGKTPLQLALFQRATTVTKYLNELKSISSTKEIGTDESTPICKDWKKFILSKCDSEGDIQHDNRVSAVHLREASSRAMKWPLFYLIIVVLLWYGLRIF